jgi:Spy/CpxP family protein refolding chaperone
MMGGYGPGSGYGPGMMRGYGGGLAALNLTPEQADKIAAIQEDVRRKNWDAMGQMRGEMFKLQRLYNADNVDTKVFADQQKKVDELRRQMITSHLESRKQIESILTPEQRKQFKRLGPWWMGEEEGG